MIKEYEISKKIEEIKLKNNDKINKEVKQTIKDLKKNEISLSNKNGDLDLKIKTNKRTVAVATSVFALNAALIGFGAYKVSKYIAQRKKLKLQKELENMEITVDNVPE